MQLRSLLIIMLTISLSWANIATAAVKVKDVSLAKLSDSNRMTISFSGKFSGAPEMIVRDQMLQVVIPGAIVWPRIEKRAAAAGKKFDTTLMAYQYNKQMVRVRAMLPYSLKYRAGDVDIRVKQGKVEVTFPRINSSRNKIGSGAGQYDESYLAGLLKDKKEHPTKASNDSAALSLLKQDLKNAGNKGTHPVRDEVKVTQFSLDKGDNKGATKVGDSGFLLEYVAKFVIFLGVVLGIFYGVMHLFKKGVLKRGNFNFLDNTKLVTVLNTTYLGPKRSLMLVKVNQQIFLLGSSESGINMLSEIDSPSALLKEGEQVLSGSNFDNVFDRAEISDKSVKLKDSPVQESREDSAGVKKSLGSHRAKQKIKNRLKNIKSLQ